jgi:hypothetical protein
MFNTADGALSATAAQVTNFNNKLHILKVILTVSPRLACLLTYLLTHPGYLILIWWRGYLCLISGDLI